MSKLTPKLFLISQGIELKATQLLSFIDGAMRSPDLVWLMDQYHLAKLKELDIKLDIKPDGTISINDLEFIKE